MKIAVSAAGSSLEDVVDPRFGRCACFLIINPDTLDVEVLDNTGRQLSGGAGVDAAQRVADRGVTHVLTGTCGPNAQKILSAAGPAPARRHLRPQPCARLRPAAPEIPLVWDPAEEWAAAADAEWVEAAGWVQAAGGRAETPGAGPVEAAPTHQCKRSWR